MARLVRRLPRALLVALVTALAFGGLVGTVQATDGQQGVPDEVAVPMPSVGDRWTYQAVLEGPWSIGENDSADGVAVGRPFAYAEFEWLDPAVVRDADGREMAVDRLAAATLRYSGGEDWWSEMWGSGWGDWFSTTDFTDEDAWIPSREVLLLRSGTSQGIAVEAATESYGDDPQANFTVTGLQVPVSFWDVETITGWGRTFGDAGVPCLARWDRQGTVIDTGSDVVLTPGCLPGFEDEAWQYRAQALETVAGRTAVRFDAARSSVWLSPDLPVPVQWRGEAGDRVATVTLTSWSPGTGALGVPARPESTAIAPPIELAPRQPWGPDDRGVDHPFPASAAFQGAMADPAWPNLRDWMEAHPGAFTFLLEYNEDLSVLPNERQWLFVMTDGADSWGFVATQESVPGLPMPLATRHEDAGWTSQYLAILAPDPDVVPDLLPTVASVLARWEAFEASEGRQDAANGWGMVMHCPLGCLDLESLLGWGSGSFPWTDLSWLGTAKVGYAEVVAGRNPIALMRVEDVGTMTPSPPGLPGERAFSGSQLTVRDGSTTRLIQWTGYATSGAAVGPLSTQDPVPVGDGDEGDPPNGVGRSLSAFLPTPEQGAAITLASALAGLLYWLWPSLKGGSFAGLFSRLHGPALLQHPSRRRLMDLVQAEPGIHFQDLVRKSGLANGTAVHHVHKLTQAGLVSARPLGRYTCYFPGSSIDRATLAAAPVTRSDGARRILAELAANPGLSGQEVAVRLGLQHSTVSYHVKRLQDVGLVAAQRDGRVVRFRTVARA